MSTPTETSKQKKKRDTRAASLPGAKTMIKMVDNEMNAFPSGQQYADDPTVNPPYHNSPDNKLAKRQASKEIIGWGVDLDHRNRAGYPKENFKGPDSGAHWKHPERQVPHVTIFHSTERPGITPVFGSTCPPRGMSGVLRKGAFGYSENDLRHWLMLLFADRVDEVEGILEDLMAGHIPNVFAERGLGAGWKYNRKGMILKTAGFAAAVGIPVLLYLGHRRNRSARLQVK